MSSVPPLSLVWTPIPLISWLLPFIGHLGITDSDGWLHDWHGTPIAAARPRDMLFGEPARYFVLDTLGGERWDRAIATADAEFAHHMHVMGCGYDCHSHVARALNLVKYMGCACHNKVALAFVIFFFGRHVSWRAVLKVWLPPVVIAALVYLVILV